MADATAFNLTAGLEAERKLMTTWVNVGTTIAKEWECVGVGVEDSSIDTNPDITTSTDILGVTRTKVNKLERAQTLDPMTVRGGSDLQVKLYNQMRHDSLAEMSAYEVMIVHGYVGSAGTYEAELFDACTITVSSVGGSSYVDMPIDIAFGGNHLIGTATTYASTSTPVWTVAS